MVGIYYWQPIYNRRTWIVRCKNARNTHLRVTVTEVVAIKCGFPLFNKVNTKGILVYKVKCMFLYSSVVIFNLNLCLIWKDVYKEAWHRFLYWFRKWLRVRLPPISVWQKLSCNVKNYLLLLVSNQELSIYVCNMSYFMWFRRIKFNGCAQRLWVWGMYVYIPGISTLHYADSWFTVHNQKFGFTTY